MTASVAAFGQADTAAVAADKKIVAQLRHQIQKLGGDTLKPRQVDSLTNALAAGQDSLGISRRFNAADSMAARTAKPGEFINGKAALANQQVSARRDSLLQPVDKLNDRLNNAGRTAHAKTDSLQQATEHKAQQLQQKLENKAEKVAGSDMAIPQQEGLGLPQTNVPGVSLPGVDVPNASVNLPRVEQPALPAMPGMKTSLPEVQQLQDMEQVSGGVDKALSEAGDYTETLSGVKDAVPEDIEDLSSKVEEKVAAMAPVKGAAGELSNAAQEKARHEAMLQKYRDHKLMQEEIKRKADALANEQMEKYAGKVTDAQKKLENSKAQANKVKGVKDVLKRRSDELDGKKFYQRLVPGITWQVYKKEFVSADLALQVGYRFTPRLTAGIGGIYRLGFSEDFDLFVQGLDTYGGRAYFDFTLKRGLFLHGEFEALRTQAPATPVSVEPVPSKVYGSYFGLGKRFNITRNLRGSIQGLYRVEYAGELPDVNKVTARFGLEYVFKRPKRKLPGL